MISILEKVRLHSEEIIVSRSIRLTMEDVVADLQDLGIATTLEVKPV
jgi:hypothetical protein